MFIIIGNLREWIYTIVSRKVTGTIHPFHLTSVRWRLSHRENKREDYENRSVLYCVPQLYPHLHGQFLAGELEGQFYFVLGHLSTHFLSDFSSVFAGQLSIITGASDRSDWLVSKRTLSLKSLVSRSPAPLPAVHYRHHADSKFPRILSLTDEHTKIQRKVSTVF